MKNNFKKTRTTRTNDQVFYRTDDREDQTFVNYLNLINPSNRSPMYHNPPQTTHQQTHNQPAKIRKDK